MYKIYFSNDIRTKVKNLTYFDVTYRKNTLKTVFTKLLDPQSKNMKSAS